LKSNESFNNSTSFRLKIIIIISYIILAIIINLLFSALVADSKNKKSNEVEHRYKVILEAKKYFSAIQDTETGQRGYLLTQDRSYLAPYYDGLLQSKKSFKQLSNLSVMNTPQLMKLQDIEKIMYLKFDELDTTIQKKNLLDSLEIVRKDHGKKYMNKIRNLLADFIKAEELSLQKRKVELYDTTQKHLMIVRITFSVFLLGLFYFLYRSLNSQYKIGFFKQEQELYRQQSELQKAIDNHSIVAITDTKGNITYVNDKFIQISGYCEDELIGCNHRLLNSGVHTKDFWKAMYSSIKNKQTWKDEVCNRSKDGSLYWVDTTIVPILDKNNDIKNYIAIRTDISQRKKNETELLQANKKAINSAKIKSEFLANMSHEIRTPLNAIIGFIELLQEKEKEKEKQKYLNIINNSSKNLLNIINDILDFSKIESGKFTIEEDIFNPMESFKLIEGLFTVNLESKNIQFDVEYKNLPTFLIGDILRITQVLNNLLSNAIKFTPEDKKISLFIQYDKENLDISVKDEGIGISTEYQSKIFDVFSQEDSSTTRVYGGTGLGLAISYNLVKAMGSELKFHSTLGKGSEFYFSLPIIESKQTHQNISINHTADLGNKKSLLVEDNLSNQMFMSVILKKMNLDFDIANNGLEAIEMFQKNRYDVIFMDENMPKLTGIEATIQIREMEKKEGLVHTPIIALTANALPDDRKRFLKAGMDEYMTKPLNQKKLTSILNNILQ